MALKRLKIAQYGKWNQKIERCLPPPQLECMCRTSQIFFFSALLCLSKWPWKCGNIAFEGSQVNLSKGVNVQTLNPQVIKINCSYYTVTRLRWKFLSERILEGHAIASFFHDKISINRNSVYYQNKVLFLVAIKSPSLKILTLALHLPLGGAISFVPLICMRYTVFIFVLNGMFQRP